MTLSIFNRYKIYKIETVQETMIFISLHQHTLSPIRTKDKVS